MHESLASEQFRQPTSAIDAIGGGGSSLRAQIERDGSSYASVHIDDLLTKIVKQGASDLHIQTGQAPFMRVNGELVRMGIDQTQNGGQPLPIDQQQARRLIYEILSDTNIQKFETFNDLDFSYALPQSKSRFRVNVFESIGGIGAVFRSIPAEVPTVEQLGLPPVLKQIADLPRGLVLVTGITGSGKSTTLAALVDHINKTRSDRIITIEDPVEYVHESKKCLVTHREVGMHTKSFSEALRAALREDPDVIVIGEMRDLETIEAAVTAAETGHLVFGTLHTPNAPESITRIVEAFPASVREQIRIQLAANLKAVMSQQLLMNAKKDGRELAMEIMINDSAIGNLIRKNTLQQIPSHIQMGRERGMITMDASLANLVTQGRVTKDEALGLCHNKDEFLHLVSSPGTNGTASRPNNVR